MESIRFKEIYDFISRVADLEFQKRVWLTGEEKDIAFSMGELINLLDDYFFFDDLDSICSFINTEREEKIIKEFSKRILDYNEPRNIEIIFSDKEWLSVVKMAEEVMVILKKANQNYNKNKDKEEKR